MKLSIKYIAAALALGMTSSCTDSFERMNEDPGSLTDVSPAYILPFIQETGSNLDSGPYQRGDNLHSQMYCQYFTNTTAGWTCDRYGYNDGWADPGFWVPYYTVMKHVKIIKDLAAANESYTNYYQMARITEAYCSIGMTDLFGDVPYTEAGIGNATPKYDSQKDIYYDVFNELKEAAETLQKKYAGQEPCGPDNDLLYSGDIDKWVRFANSLRLRYALRLAFIDPDKAKAEGEAALAAGVMQSNDDNAYLRITASGGWGHPLYMICNWNGFVMSKTMENILKKSSTVPDPRMPLWFGQTVGYVNNKKEPVAGFKGERFQGVPNGRTDVQLGEMDADNYKPNDPNNNSCVYGLQAFPNWNTKDEVVSNTVVALPFKVMNYAEVCQLKAEAALRGWKGAGDVKTNYEEGIRSSFAEESANVDKSAFNSGDEETYITTGNVKWNDGDSQEAKLEKIITQKWLAVYPNGIEAWAECRRTGYPKLMTVSQSDDPDIKPANGEFIKKIRYSDAERRENGVHANDASLNQGQGDGQNVRVWWDTKRYK